MRLNLFPEAFAPVLAIFLDATYCHLSNNLGIIIMNFLLSLTLLSKSCPLKASISKFSSFLQAVTTFSLSHCNSLLEMPLPLDWSSSTIFFPHITASITIHVHQKPEVFHFVKTLGSLENEIQVSSYTTYSMFLP